MEDSRNIIKAIDAMTLKTGGEVVDSKNITEAIDHLKEVYSQEAIGIDKTLTEEGLAADAKAVGDEITKIKTNFIITNSVEDLCTKVAALPVNVNATLYTDSDATKFLTQDTFRYSAKGLVARVNNTLADACIVAYPDICFSVRFDLENKEVTSCIKLPTRSEIDIAGAIGKAIDLPLDADANHANYRVNGFHVYNAIFSENRTNFPSAFKGGLFIDVGASDMHWQFCCNYDSGSILWFRNYYTNWKEWKQLTN